MHICSCPTCSDLVQPLTQIIFIRVEEGQLLHVLFRDEVQDLSYVPVLDDGHALDRALSLHPDVVDTAAATGAAQLAKAVEIGQSGHGTLIRSGCPTEQSEALW